MRKIIKSAVIIADMLIIVLLVSIIYYQKCLPDSYYVTSGSRLKLSEPFEAVPCVSTENVKLKKESAEESLADLKLWGIFPIKTVSVRQVDNPVLVPCGEPFGIKLLTDGVIVVEVSSFQTASGFRSPAKQCGIKSGDIIKTVDGKNVRSNSEIEEIISSGGGESVRLELVRDGLTFYSELSPLVCTADDTYRAGIWVRDSSAGIGTVTFYNPDTKVFAGLGHPVCDIDTGKPLPLYSGEVVKVSINGVKKGSAGAPGELIGTFSAGFPIGELELNTENGLFGTMGSFAPENQGIPLGFRQDVTLGKAYIYSTISGSDPEKYDITIEKIDLTDSSDSRNMVIRVTDSRLIEKTGGIVQGMSGSPIIQDGKLIGAVTHVFVNNPTKGYAVFADKMYEQSKNAELCMQ